MRSVFGLPLSLSFGQSSQRCVVSAGSQCQRQPTTATIGGSRAASARTAVLLPVPRSPKTSTPPMPESTAAIRIASFISSWATMAENGNGTAM